MATALSLSDEERQVQLAVALSLGMQPDGASTIGNDDEGGSNKDDVFDAVALSTLIEKIRAYAGSDTSLQDDIRLGARDMGEDFRDMMAKVIASCNGDRAAAHQMLQRRLREEFQGSNSQQVVNSRRHDLTGLPWPPPGLVAGDGSDPAAPAFHPYPIDYTKLKLARNFMANNEVRCKIRCYHDMHPNKFATRRLPSESVSSL